MYEVLPNKLNPIINSNIKSKDTIKKIIDQVKKTLFIFLEELFSIKNWIAKANIANLINPTHLEKEFTKSEE